MPRWSETPPEEKTPYTYRILRTPAKGALVAISTSTDVIGTCTHFVKNRTIPCDFPDPCDWCDQGFSHRWHGYLGCLVTATMEPAIFEFTAASSKTFKAYARQYSTLRGCHFQAARPSGKTNGRVVIACKPADLQRINLPEPFDVRRILCHIWNIQFVEAEPLAGIAPCFKTIPVPPGNGDGRY